jgi:hypothetical protein
MAQHKLSLKEQLRGVEKALRKRRLPKPLRKGLRKRKAQLERALSTQDGVNEDRPPRRPRAARVA